jgi:hypothetical protein
MKLKFVFLFICFTSIASSQLLKGTVKDTLGTVPFASIRIKDGNNTIKQFTTSNENGTYQIELTSRRDSLYLEVSTLFHEPKTIGLVNQKMENNSIKIDVFLKPRINQLKEVVITKAPPIVKKKDTLEFNPDSFKDGTEKVVEDLLKKLPGIKVEENGIITYKGKEIKKLLLDGDDLFDGNYTTGSRNISVNMVEKVQGLENYEENSLLKGIKHTDEVAINLVLKKGESDFSGNASLGYGIENRHYGTATGILINKKVKGFGVSSINNIGINNSPYNFNSEVLSIESIRNKKYTAKSLLSEGNFNSILDASFHNLNNNFYTSLNGLYKVYKKSVFKINAGFYLDKLTRVNESSSQVMLNNSSFTINEVNRIRKKPQIIDANLLFANKEKERFHWEYIAKLTNSRINTFETSINNGFLQNSAVQTEALSLTQTLNSTFKISEKKALTNSLLFVRSKTPQNLVLNPDTTIDFESQLRSSIQNSEFIKEFSMFNTSYLINNGDFLYAIQTNLFQVKNSFISDLQNINSISLGSDFQNNTTYKIKNWELNPVVVFNKNRYSLKFSLSSIFNETILENKSINDKQRAFYVLPKFTAVYRNNENSSFTLQYTFNQVLPEEDKTFDGIVQINYRNYQSNTISINFLKTHTYLLTYNYNNLFDLTRFNVTLNHNYRPNNIFNRTIINQNITISNHFFSAISNRDYGFTVSGEKYFHSIRTTFQFNSSFFVSFDNNIVNDSEIRKVRNDNYTFNFIGKRTLFKKFVLENKLFLMNSRFNVASENLSNNFQMVSNQTKLVYKAKKELNTSLIANYVIPNINSKNKYTFIDFEINYTPKNRQFNYSVVGKNLTNIKNFTTNNVTSFSNDSSTHNLIQRYLIFKMTFDF